MDTHIYSSEQIRALEQRVFAKNIVSSDDLMLRAGQAAFDALQKEWPNAKRLAVFCGHGNNGGDGYVIAYLAQQANYQVEVFYSSLPKTPDAQLMMHAAMSARVPMQQWVAELSFEADVIVDALLGTGLNSPVTGIFAEMIQVINAHYAPVLAIDIPSGIAADTGALCGVAIDAELTVTFIGYKLGSFTGEGASHVGQLVFKKLLQLTPDFYPKTPMVYRLEQSQLQLPKRPRHCHKGDFGHVLVIGGDEGMGGAVMMAAEAALRSGAGKVTVATHPNHVSALLARCPEVMVRGIQHVSQLQPLIELATVIVIGMGLGRQAWGQRLWLAVQETHKPMIVDADALYWLAQQPTQRDNWILTPHGGEAGRLLACDHQHVDNNRFESVQQLVARYGGVVLLKGVGSLIADKNCVNLCPYGNAGMATAGMGDTLAGIMAGLVAQFGLSLATASQAVVVHALAGDMAAEAGERGLIATDLLPHLRVLLNG